VDIRSGGVPLRHVRRDRRPVDEHTHGGDAVFVDCRRAERGMVALEPAVEPVLLKYINRLSDLLFVLARTANQRAGAAETIW